MPDPRELFPIRRAPRDPREDFWAIIRVGSALALALWLTLAALGTVL